MIQHVVFVLLAMVLGAFLGCIIGGRVSTGAVGDYPMIRFCWRWRWPGRFDRDGVVVYNLGPIRFVPDPEKRL